MVFCDSCQPPPCPGGTHYRIQPGDSYYGLARRFGTTVEALYAANPGVDPANLIIGQVICIPVPPTPGPCPGGFQYVIRSGDTFYSIARRYGISVEALVAANPGVDPDRLRVGQVICVPAPPKPFCPEGTVYTVRQGDTMYLISQRFGISLERLIAANPQIPDPNVIQIGDRICIPRR